MEGARESVYDIIRGEQGSFRGVSRGIEWEQSLDYFKHSVRVAANITATVQPTAHGMCDNYRQPAHCQASFCFSKAYPPFNCHLGCLDLCKIGTGLLKSVLIAQNLR